VFKFLIFLLSTSLATSCTGLRKASLIPGAKRSSYEAFGKKYMVSSQGKYATQAGLDIFELGGNVIDAAAAISFVLSVERPQSTGLGGGGFMLYFGAHSDKPMAIDFREKAPLKAHKNMYLDSAGNVIEKKSLDGIFAAGVPGLVAGIVETHEKYGKLPLKTILRPAIKLAEDGFKIYPELAKALGRRASVLVNYPASKKIFFEKGQVLKEGDHLIQKDLAKTLRSIAANGRNGFYAGWVANAIVKESLRLKGLISHRDLRKYNVKQRTPVVGKYKKYEIYSMAPPSSGGVHILQILNILENDQLGKLGPQHPQSIHLTASAMQAAFADRAKYLGDADFVKVPVAGLISKKYAKEIRSKFSLSKARKNVIAENPFPYESSETTHFTVMDSAGEVVSSTQTINGYFGSGVVVPGTGIVLNNEMDDFANKVGAKNLFGAIGGDKNLVHAEKRPLSSMSPTIVFRDKTPILALGTPSGTRILTCVAQTILNYIEYNLPLYDSVAAIRYHQQWSPDEIRIDEKGFSSDVEDQLTKMGHSLRHKNLGCRIQAIAKENNSLHGVSDPRGQGLSKGL